ncbi:RimK family alpha-L-glutamate ligase [Gammaproteobacteria bacterium]
MSFNLSNPKIMNIPDISDFAPLVGIAPWARLAFLGENLSPIGESLLDRAIRNPEDANAILDFSIILQLVGQREHALAVQSEAIRIQQNYTIFPKNRETNFRLLVLMGLGDLMANTPIEFLVEDSDIQLDILYLTLDTNWPEEISEHDAMLVAVAESDQNQPILKRLIEYVHAWPRPIINHPKKISILSRDGVYNLLKDVPELFIPKTVRIARELLQTQSENHFPIIIRPCGSHAGQGLAKLDRLRDLIEYLTQVSAHQFYVSPFVQYQSEDGLFRKYRIAMINGKPFFCHMAISEHWMVHYLNAGMSENIERRNEEARCMENFDQVFAARHANALRKIQEKIGLPYFGIDCAETKSGELLIFEIDNAMVVHSMDSENLYPYKKPAMKKLFDAFHLMLKNAH